jgi:hypothetical protein
VQLGAIVIFGSWFGDVLAEKLVDPNSVAPEYRAVAEKRRAEQIKLFECSRKADTAKSCEGIELRSSASVSTSDRGALICRSRAVAGGLAKAPAWRAPLGPNGGSPAGIRF